MYKDKDRQREANRQAKARYKARQGIPLGIPSKGIPDEGIPVKPVAPSKKRGMEIQSFEDLPLDVQADIELMAVSKSGGDEGVYERERRDRTERAIRYQHLFPDRFYPGGREVARQVQTA